ncbi:unnamed protein product [Arabidopsis halleri]
MDGASIQGEMGMYKPEEFTVGDLLWAKCGKRFPAWPSVVIDPISQAPDEVFETLRPRRNLCHVFWVLQGWNSEGLCMGKTRNLWTNFRIRQTCSITSQVNLRRHLRKLF